MNWKRYKFLIVSGAVSLVAVIVLVVMILRTGAQTAELRSDVLRLKGSQSQLAAMRPFPSEASHAFLRDKNEALTERRAQIKEIILEGQITPVQMSRSLFGDFVRTQFVPPLIAGAAVATRGGDDGVILRDPSFGLQEYLDGALPEPQEIPQLMIRLETMRHMALVLFGTGISELVRIEPRRAEEGTTRPGTRPRAAAPATGGLFAGQQATQPRADVPASTPDQTVTSRRRELFEEVSFTVSVKIYEDKLWGLLNALAADDNQVVVRNLTITNGNQQLWPAYLRPDTRMGAAAARTQAAARAERRPANPLLAALMNQADTPAGGDVAPAARPGLRERRDRTVGGELLDVSFDVTFYRLKPVAQGS
ncbi:MAG: Amuc_1100 family pilus-like protein [Verrucomicrobia bacterium]|nr:Amuc_1100 family pilus-like protein [Verrucomicrobiota bacterium]MCH8526318.1 Amuc_1100 family pilus-like protein [Kiritimatiellia bacterium]